jgi:hypothetical protein
MNDRFDLTAEECARRIIQRELGRRVLLHDDGRRARMYDLRIGAELCPDIAIECVGAVDPQRTETWNIGPAKGAVTVPVPGDWHVVIRPDTRVKQVRSALPELLSEFQTRGLHGFTPVDAFLQVEAPELYEPLAELKIDSVSWYEGSPGPGKLYLGMTGCGGAVDPRGTEVPPWISDFLRAEERRDVLQKLQASGARECHVFVIVSFGGVPWLVESYLGTDTDLLPLAKPDLPEPVDSVWIMYGASGVRWDGNQWRFFSAVIPAFPE